MPTYVYECATCANTFEVEQRITENPLTDCNCGSKGTLKRLIQPTAIMFKGAGFHINDYAAKSAAPEAKAETKAETPACSGEPKSCPACSSAAESGAA